MPCDCSYMEASGLEVQLSRVACLLDELNGKKWKKSWWNGYHPDVYCKDTRNGDGLVTKLCSALQKVDVSKYSLEMQVWWRDHQEADRKRVKAELAAKKKQVDKTLALSKLTPYERRLLGIE